MICCYSKYNFFQMNICQQNPLNGQAFEEVNDILDDNQSPSEVQILTFKINQMQKIIATLTRTNERLINRIEQLQQEMQQKNTTEQTTSFNEEYSVMQCDFNDIEEMIKEYRKQLTTYQQKIDGQIKEKNKTIEFLRQENDDLKNNNEKLKLKIDEIQMQNEMLLQTKDNLLNEIQQLEASNRKSNLQSPRYSNRYADSIDYGKKYDDNSSDFNTNVQRQLQKLIQKLVKQLQHQRHLKKKLTEEVRKLQRDIFQQEKQLMSKNNKIYAMEMNAIKKYKTNTSSVTPKSKNQRYDSKISSKPYEERSRIFRDKDNGQSSPTSKSKTFTLMQLMNQCVVLSSKEKLIIAMKIIDFFLKKFQKHDYSSQILESIVIWNFNPINTHLCSVRLNKQIEKDQNLDERDYSQAEGIWNLAFVLDNLFNQTYTKDHDFGMSETEESIVDTIVFMLQNKDQNMLRTVLDLQRTVESALGQRNQ